MSERGKSGRESHSPIKQFERNNYFFGKLMTVRDVQAEQDYFNEKRHLLNRLVTGTGLVYGLKVTNVTRNAVEGWDAHIDPGVALDCCGREIVVCSSTTPKKIKEVLVDVDKVNSFGLYVKRADCEKELTVSIANKSKCEDVCCSNRIKENYELVLDEEPDLVELSREIDLDSEGIQLANIYYSDYLESYLEAKDIEPRVLVAVLAKKVSGETVTLEPNKKKTAQSRRVVYNNPMLFELFNAHLQDDDNPHGVTADQVMALKTVEGVGNTDPDTYVPNVDFVSDGTIQIEGDVGANEVSFKLAPITSDQIEDGTITWSDVSDELKRVYSKVRVNGSEEVEAGLDRTFELNAGMGITLTGDAENRRITIAAETSRDSTTSRKTFGKIEGNETVISEAIEHNVYHTTPMPLIRRLPPPSITLGMEVEDGTILFMEDLSLMKAVYKLNLLTSRPETEITPSGAPGRTGGISGVTDVDLVARRVDASAPLALSASIIRDSFSGSIRESFEGIRELREEDVVKIPELFKNPRTDLYFKAITINDKTFKICLINTGTTTIDNVVVRWWATPAREIPELKLKTPVLAIDEPLEVGIELPEGLVITEILARTEDTETEIQPTEDSTPEMVKVEIHAVEELTGEGRNEIVLPTADDIMTLEIKVLDEGVRRVIRKEVRRKARREG